GEGLPLDRLGAIPSFQTGVSRRNERGAILITPNQSLIGWRQVFEAAETPAVEARGKGGSPELHQDLRSSSWSLLGDCAGLGELGIPSRDEIRRLLLPRASPSHIAGRGCFGPAAPTTCF